MPRVPPSTGPRHPWWDSRHRPSLPTVEPTSWSAGRCPARRRDRMVEALFIGSVGENGMRVFQAIIERCPETGLLVGYVPGFPGAHSQGETLDELQANLR